MEPNSRDVVLVTGSSGFIGRALVRSFAQRYRVVALDRDSPSHPPAEAECVCIDLTSESSLHAALERVRVAYGQRIAAIVHLAAYFDLEGKPDPHYERITIRGTERLLHALRPFQLEQFVFASTMLVHAPSRPGTRIDEDSPIDAQLPYPASKIATERMLHEQHADVPLVVVRPSGVYDDGGHAAFLAEQISRIYERSWQAHVYPGDPRTGQPFLHLDDLVDALVRIVDRRRSLPPELTLLLAETQTPSFGELQHAIGSLLYGEQWKTVKIPQVAARVGAALENSVLHEDAFVKPWMVDISSDHYEVDISRASRWLDWHPRHALLAQLPRIIEGLKADPPGWYRSNKLDPALVAERAATVLGEPAPAPEAEVQRHVQHMRGMHFDMLWVHWLNLMLGAWLISSVFAFGLLDLQGFSDAVWQVTRERSLPDPQQRLHWLAVSDLVSGALVTGFAALSLSPRFAWGPWANAAMGFWLLLAPLVFWSPSAAVYANDTLVGTLVIAFAIIVPMMPGMSVAAMMDASEVPVGWSSSPSSYLQRLPIIALGFAGFVVARQLAAYQLGHVNGVWEPFFGGSGGRNGTESIVTSSVSKAWPVADGGLGAVGYLFEVLMGAMGDGRRWRTMPWMVAAFGVVVVPLGVISIYFIVIQPIVLGTWCTLCLIAASAMLVMIPLTLDELVAMGQFLVQSHRRGETFWRTFLTGGVAPGAGRDTQPGFDAPLRTAFAAAVRGVTVPWTLAASVALGVALMFTRLTFGTRPPMADSDHLAGAMIVTVAVCAMAEVARPLRFINIGLGLWLLAAPWVLAGASRTASVAGMLVGLAVIVLSLPRGSRSQQQYGAWNRWIL